MNKFRRLPDLKEVKVPYSRKDKLAHTKEYKQATYDMEAMKRYLAQDKAKGKEISWYRGELIMDHHVEKQQYYIDKLRQVRKVSSPDWKP